MVNAQFVPGFIVNFDTTFVNISDANCSVDLGSNSCLGDGGINLGFSYKGSRVNPRFDVTITPFGGGQSTSITILPGAPREISLTNLCAIPYIIQISAFGDFSSFFQATVIVGGSTIFETDPTINNVSCVGENSGEINLNISGGTPPYEIRWNHGPTTETISNLVAGAYSVEIEDDFGCISNDTLTVAPGDTITADFTFSNVCENILTTFTDASSNSSASPLVYEWNFTNGNPASANTQGSHDVSFASSGSKNIQLVVNNGTCSDTSNQSITIFPSPTISITNDTAICNGQSVQLNVSGGTSYSWLPNDGSLNDVNSPNPIASPLTTTKYYVTATTANGCIGVDSVTVTVNSLPVLNPTPSDTTVCEGESVQLQVGAGGTYVWTPSTGLNNTSIFNPTASPSTSTIYKVIMTTGVGCSDSTNVTVNITPRPTIGVSPNQTICNGDSLKITATGGVTYIWTPNNGSLSATTIPDPFAKPTTTTQYEVEGYDASGCYDSAFVTVSVNPTPILTVSPDDSICIGSSISLSASGANSYLWTPNNGTLSATNIANPTATPLTTTSYIVRGRNAFNCFSFDTVTITVNPIPSITISNDTAICEGQSTQLLASGASNYTWNPSITLNNNSVPNPIATPVSSTMYIVIGENGFNCQARDSVLVTINQLPSLTITSDTAICEGLSIPLSVSGALTYTWLPNDGSLNDISSATPIATPAAATVYNVTGTDANNCSSTATVTISINSLPTIQAEKDTTLCAVQPVQLSATGGVSYAWSPTNFLDNSTSQTPISTPTSSTMYVVTGTDGNGCIGTDTVNINVFSLPNVIVSNDTTLCFGGSAPLLVSGATTYSWTPSLSLSNSSIPNPIASPSSSTTYVVTGTDGNNCSNSDTVTITVNPLPNIIISPNDTICKGESSTLTASGGSTYLWSDASTLSSSTTPSTIASPLIDTRYKVEVTTLQGCIDSAFVEVVIDPIITINIVQNDTICFGDTITLSAIVANGVDFSWNSNTGNILTPSQLTSKAIPTITDYYVLTVTNNIGCTNSDSIQVVVETSDVLNAIAIDDTICFGDSTQLIASGSGSNIIWQQNGFVSSPNDDTTFVNPITTTTFFLSANTTGGCSAIDSITINVTPLPNGTLTNDTSLCIGDTIQLVATGGSSYDWGTPYKGTILSANVLEISPDRDTTYSVKIFNAQGCFDSLSVNVKVNQLPILASSNDTTICSGNTISLLVNGGITYQWTPSLFLNDSSLANPISIPTSDITYIVYGTDGNSCINSDTISITVNPLPTLLLSSDTSICFGESTLLNVSGAIDYSWSPVVSLDDATSASPIATPNDTTTYIIVGTDGNNCSNTDSLTVFVNPLPVITTSPNDTICNGDSTLLTATGGNSYIWTGVNVSSPTSPSTFVSPSNDAQYKVEVRTTFGCLDSAFVDVLIDPVITINIIQNDTICLGDSVTLSAIVANGVDFLWTTGIGTLLTPSQLTTIAIPTVNEFYTLTVTNSIGCTNSDSLFVVVENPNTFISINTDKDSICSGESTLLVASGAATNYTWQQNGFVITPNNDSTLVTPTSTTSFIVTGSTSNGCSAFDTITIFVDPIPTGTISNDTTICIGDTINLKASGGISYDWGTPYRATILSPDVLQVFTDRDTTYSVKVFNSLGCYDSLTVAISINELPLITITPVDTVCLGDTITITATASNIATSSWTTGAGTIFTPTQLTTDIEPLITEFYKINLTDNNDCSNSDSILVIVESSPNINITALTDSICEGDSVLLTANGAATNITWIQNGFISSPNDVSTFVTPTNTTIFVVRGKTTDGCDAIDSFTVFVDPIPVTGLPNDTSLCMGDSIVLTAVGGASYDWGTPYRALLLSPNSLQVFPDKDTSYTVIASNNLSCATNTTINVTINSLPSIVASKDTSLCENQPLPLNVSGGTNYSWSPSLFLNDTTSASPTSTPLSDITYIVTGSDLNGCFSSDTVSISVIAAPLLTVNNDTSICVGEVVQLNAIGNAIDYNWSPSASLNDPTIANPLASPTTTTTYTVLATTGSNCTAFDSITVTVSTVPSIIVSATDTICKGDSTLLTASGGAFYTWSGGPLSSPNTSSTFVSPTVDTRYKVEVTTLTGCFDSAFVDVLIDPIININIIQNDTVCLGDTITLSAIVANGVSFKWTTTTGDISTPDSLTTTAIPFVSEDYILTVTNSIGCTNSDSIFVVVETSPDLSITSLKDSLCIGETTLLIASGASNITWFQNGFIDTPNNDSTIINPTATTTFIAKGETPIGCDALDSITISVVPTPIGTLPNDTTICLGDTIAITANGGVAYDWGTPYRGITSSINTLQVFTDRDTTYSVKVFNSLGCYDSVSISIFINSLPTITINPLDTVCLGDTVSLEGTTDGIISSLWTTGAGSILNPIQLTTDIVPFVSEFYKLTIIDTNGCSNTDSTFVPVLSSPGLTITTLKDSLCSGDSTLLVASGATDIIWLQNGFVTTPTNDSTFVVPTNTATFIARGKTTSGCDALDSIQIFVDQIPSLNITNDNTICSGDSILIIVSGASNYVWSPLYRANQLSPDSIIAFPDIDTSYQVSVTTPTGCSQSADTKISVNEKPNVSISGDTSICLGKTIQLIANSSSASTYTWKILDSTTVLGTNDTLEFNPLADLIVTVEVNSIANCTNKDTVSISTSGLQNTIASNDTIVCAGDSIVLFATGGNNYSWTPSMFLSDTTAPITYTKPLSDITYTVTISTNDGCSAIHTIQITTNPIPTGQLVLNQDSSCFGDAFIATATIDSPSIPHPSAAYSFDNGISFKNSNSTTFTPSGAGDTTITIVFKDNLGCTSITPIETTHTTLTPISFSIDTLVIPSCTPPPGEFRVHSFTGGLSPYAFSLNGGSSVITADTTIKNVLPGTYLITIKDSYNCKSDNNLNFISSITFDTTVVHPKCFGDSTGLISFSNIRGGLNPYQFSFGDTLNYISDSIFKDLTAGVKTIFLKDASGCLLQINKELNSNSEITIQTISKNDINCFGDNNGTLSINIEGGSTPYTVTRKTETQNGTNIFTFNNLQPGLDTLLINDNISCSALLAFEITEANPIKSYTRITSSPSGCNSSDGIIKIDSTIGGSNSYEFSIDGGLTFMDSLSVSNSLKNITSGVYQLITKDSLFGCTDTLPIFLNASNGLLLDSIIPVIQNPNCDNLNGLITLTNLLGAPRPYEFKLMDASSNSTIINYQSDSTFTALVAGSYNVIIKDTASCEYFYPIMLKSYSKINSFLTVVESSCGLDNGQVIVNATNGSGKYEYSIQDVELTTNIITQIDSTFKNLSNDTYIITLTDTEEPTCSSTDTAVVLTTSVGLLVKTDTTTCFGASDARVTILDITNADTSFYRFEFSLDDTLGFTEDRIFNNLKGGAHTVFIKQIDKLTNQECVYADLDETANNTRLSSGSGKSFEIPEPQILNAKITTLPSDYGEATGSIFVYEVQGGTGPYSFSINDSLTYVPFASLDSVANESRGYEEGYHYVFIKDKNGCLLKLETEVGRTLYIPNIFTPNGDGKNDTFFISNLPETGAKLRIYDRWGVLSYKSFYYENDWDGKNQPDGLYYYELDTPTKIYKGWVQIVRK